MMKINDLLSFDAGIRIPMSLPEMNPLTEDDALQEAQVLEVRFDALECVLAILFELRQALQLREANTGVLVAHKVHEFIWSGPQRNTGLTAWSVGSSVPTVKDQLFSLNLVMWPHPGARMALTAESAAFFVGNVPGLPAAPPDYTLHDQATAAAELAGWNSTFEPVSAVFLDSARPV